LNGPPKARWSQYGAVKPIRRGSAAGGHPQGRHRMPVTALEAWLEAAGISEGAVFRRVFNRRLLPTCGVHHRGDRCPEDDCSIAITRDCLDPGSTFSLAVSSGADSEGFAETESFEAGDDFFAAVDIEILHSVDAARAAPPKPRVGHRASGAGSLAPFGARVSTLPLQSQSNASRFWIMLLLSFGGVRA